MNTKVLMERQLKELYLLARAQRSLRLGLRALWLGIGGILLGWSIHTIWNGLPDKKIWLLLGLILAIFPLIEFIVSLTPRSRWVWTVDRRLGLHEQVSTAWEVVQAGQPGRISKALVADVLKILPGIRKRLLRNGWFLERDFVSFVIVSILGVLVLTSYLIQSYSPDALRPEQINIPQLSEDPTAEEVFPNGPLGLQPQTGQQEGSQPSTQGDQPGNSQGAGQQPGAGQSQNANAPADDRAVRDALTQLGSQLSGQAGTHNLGEALQQLDLNKAADEMEKLAEQLQGLSPETRQKLADALQQAAGSLQNTDQQNLAGDLGAAANALQQGNGDQQNQAAGGAMGQAAGDLRDLAEQIDPQQNADSGGGGVGNSSSGTTGSAEPNQRLQGEGGNMELQVDDPSQSGLLSPASPDAGGPDIASGSIDSATGAQEEVIPGSIVPNTYLWKWRDVVSSYFQR